MRMRSMSTAPLAPSAHSSNRVIEASTFAVAHADRSCVHDEVGSPVAGDQRSVKLTNGISTSTNSEAAFGLSTNELLKQPREKGIEPPPEHA